MSGQVLTPTRSPRSSRPPGRGACPTSSAADRGRQRRMRTVDFTRPTKFTTDQERRIRRALDTFCRTASTRLSAELRMPLELEVINVASSPGPTRTRRCLPRSVSGLVEGDERRRPVARQRGDEPRAGRDRAAARRLGRRGRAAPRRGASPTSTGRWPATSSSAWSRSCRSSGRTSPSVELSLAGLDMHLETAQTAPVSEPTLALTMEARLDRDSATLALLLPYAAIAPRRATASTRATTSPTGATADAARRPRRGRPRRDDGARRGRRRRAADRAGARARSPATCSARRPRRRRRDAVRGRRPRPPGLPGRSGARRAVQVTEPTGRTAAMTADEALVKLGQSTAEAVCGVLEMFAPGQITPGDVAVVARRPAPARGHPDARPWRRGLLRRRRHGRQPVRHDGRGRAQARRGDDGHGARRRTPARPSSPSSSSPPSPRR